MALRQQLEQRQQQKLSPQQMQVIKLTELSTLEFEERIKQELEDNPALEEGLEMGESEFETEKDEAADITQEDLALGDYLNEEETPDYYFSRQSSYNEDRPTEIASSPSDSLQESLLLQLGESNLNEKEQMIGKYIIGNIGGSGYLDRPLQAISDDLIFQKNMDVSEKKLAEILEIIQDFEPAGIAARDLQECLKLQLDRLPENESIRHAKKIINKYFDEFSKRHFDKLMQQLSIDEEQLKDAQDIIIGLNPKPGSNWDESESKTSTIIPDFIVDSQNGELSLSMNNRNVPELRVSREYSNILHGYASNKKSMSEDKKNAALFVKQKLDSARWFVDAVRQRQETLTTTMQAIMEMQYDFFLTGDEMQLKPMILKDIAEKTGYDISTISRVNNSKYVQTNFAIYPLKYFFSESMQMDDGEEISSREVKAILQKCVDSENKQKPLTDEALTKRLNDKGYVIARRTVAKYREQLNIPIARLRREI